MNAPAPIEPLGQPALRVLVVEDSFLVANSLAKSLGDMGVRVIGPAATVSAALQLINQHDCDGAILDVNLGGETVEPVATALIELGRPFIFITGYSSPSLRNPSFDQFTRLSKPVNAAVLRQAIQDEFRLKL